MPLPHQYSWVLSIDKPETVVGSGRSVAGNRVTYQGKTGLALPVSPDGRGRMSLVSGNFQLEKLIILNLSDCESANPFQEGEIGIGSDMVFAIASDKLRADVRDKINKLFRRLQLQDRARLTQRPEFATNSENQEVVVDINYVNLEENKPGDLSLKFSLQNAAAPR